MIRRFILWAVRRCPYVRRRRVVSFGDIFGFRRYEFLWFDESITRDGQHHNRPPWWRPFNAFLHLWRPVPGQEEELHDHPRWSVTVCLKGMIIERTPWAERVLTPGSVVIRSRKAIHSFRVPDRYRGKTWTLFIVGRRNYRQNTYVVTAR